MGNNKGSSIKGSSPKPGPGDGLAGYTPSQMRAQLANLGISPLTNPMKRVAGDQSYAVNTYGASLGAAVKKAFVGTRFAAQEESVMSATGQQELQAGKQTIGEALSIMKSGAKQQAAAAARAASLQAQQEMGASDSQAAAFAQQVYMAELQHRWAIQDQKRAESAALRSAAGQTQSIVQGVMTSGGTIATAVQQSFLSVKDATEEGQPISANAVYTMALDQGALVEGTPEAVYARQLAQQVTANGGNISAAIEPALTGTFSGYAGFDSSMVAGAVDAGVKTNAASTRAAYIKANPGGVIAGNIPGAEPPPLKPPEIGQALAMAGNTADSMGLTDVGNGKYRDGVGNFYQYNSTAGTYVRIG